MERSAIQTQNGNLSNIRAEFNLDPVYGMDRRGRFAGISATQDYRAKLSFTAKVYNRHGQPNGVLEVYNIARSKQIPAYTRDFTIPRKIAMDFLSNFDLEDQKLEVKDYNRAIEAGVKVLACGSVSPSPSIHETLGYGFQDSPSRASIFLSIVAVCLRSGAPSL